MRVRGLVRVRVRARRLRQLEGWAGRLHLAPEIEAVLTTYCLLLPTSYLLLPTSYFLLTTSCGYYSLGASISLGRSKTFLPLTTHYFLLTMVTTH